MALDPSVLTIRLSALAPAGRVVVAFSGGADSTALLAVLATQRDLLRADLAAIHVHHGIHAAADAWAVHCAHFCAARNIPFECVHVQGRPDSGESPENAARRARYAALADYLQPGELLCTAHHRDDQAETLLLQLLRGAGPRGLAAMPFAMPLGAGRLVRPLLDVPRAALRDYLTAQHIEWIEDHSNAALAADRNYLRHAILPLLRARWPAVDRMLARSAVQCARSARLEDEVARETLPALVGPRPNMLNATALQDLSPERSRVVLRYWLRARGLPIPSDAQLERVVTELLPADAERTPLVHWPGVELRRYRGWLHADVPLAPVDADWQAQWDCVRPLQLPADLGWLRAEPIAGAGVAVAVLAERRLCVRLRRGGEICAPVRRAGRHTLKKLFQEAGIPPWQRTRMPLLFLDDRLICVPGVCIDASAAARPGEEGVEFVYAHVPPHPVRDGR